ncbi:MAG TPA: ElyC/SanA/YdcF family protein [Desulfosporosinus sp.]|nr:ElyC/SanA/YdcF family protein [Desulfosporosinus sp.]
MKKYWKRALTFSICILLVLTVSILVIDKYVEEKGKEFIMRPKDVPKADAILVLGAYVTPDGTVSPMLNDRLTVAQELYQKGIAEKLIVSGDHGRKDYDEVNTMKKFLMDRGISDQDIFMDHAGFSTYESLYRARDIFQVKKIIIVTQEYHLMRAVFIARELGIEAYGVASDLHNYGTVMAQYEVREIAARNKDFLMAKIVKPKPTFLGKAIPVFGDGRATDDK